MHSGDADLPDAAWIFADGSDGKAILAEHKEYSTSARWIHWMLYYPPANVAELERIVRDVTQNKHWTSAVRQSVLEQVAKNCRCALMPWFVDVSIAGFAVVTREPESIAILFSELAGVAEVQLSVAMKYSWNDGQTIDWHGVAMPELDGCGLEVAEMCGTDDKLPMCVSDGSRRESRGCETWVACAKEPVGEYEIFLKDPQEYWIYRPRNREAFLTMCRQSTFSRTLMLAFPQNTATEHVRRCAESDRHIHRISPRRSHGLFCWWA